MSYWASAMKLSVCRDIQVAKWIIHETIHQTTSTLFYQFCVNLLINEHSVIASPIKVDYHHHHLSLYCQYINKSSDQPNFLYCHDLCYHRFVSGTLVVNDLRLSVSLISSLQISRAVSMKMHSGRPNW